MAVTSEKQKFWCGKCHTMPSCRPATASSYLLGVFFSSFCWFLPSISQYFEIYVCHFGSLSSTIFFLARSQYLSMRDIVRLHHIFSLLFYIIFQFFSKPSLYYIYIRFFFFLFLSINTSNADRCDSLDPPLNFT